MHSAGQQDKGQSNPQSSALSSVVPLPEQSRRGRLSARLRSCTTSAEAPALRHGHPLGALALGLLLFLLPLEAQRTEEGLREGGLFRTAGSGAGHSVGRNVHTLQKAWLLSAVWRESDTKADL